MSIPAYSCNIIHRTQLTQPWRCPPTGGPPLPTEHSGCRPLPATAASSRSTLTSDPSSVALTTVHAKPTLQGDAVVSPPAREGGCAGSIANQTASRSRRRTTDRPDAASAKSSSTSLLGGGLRTHHRLQYRHSHLQQLPHLSPSLLLRSDKKQLDLQMLYNGSITTSQGTVADHQVRLRVSQSALHILQWNADGSLPRPTSFDNG